ASNINWTASGPPIMYETFVPNTNPPQLAEVIPNPSAGGPTTFSNTLYPLASQHGTSISFSWGEVPGRKTITASVTLTDAVGSVTLHPSVTVPVKGAGWTGAVKALKSAAAGPFLWPPLPNNGPDIVYGNFYYPSGGAIRALNNPGINWSTMKPYVS